MSNILVYCGVKYLEKDYFKLKGGKWDKNNKSWYMIFNLNEFIENENISTYQYKPYKIDFSQCEEYNLKDKDCQYELTKKIFDILKQRNDKFITKAEQEIFLKQN